MTPVLDLGALADGRLGGDLGPAGPRAPRGRPPDRAARPLLRAGRAAPRAGAPRRPRPGGPRAVAGPGAAHPPPGRAGLAPAAGRCRRGGRRGAGGPAPPPTPPGWRGSPGRPGSARCSATPSATPTAATPPPSTSSTPPAGWSPSTGATSTGGNAEGFLKSGKQMAEIAEEIARLSGLAADPEREAQRLLARTRAVADRCALDPRRDLGLGEVHFPEFELTTRGIGPRPDHPGCHRGRRAAAGALRGRARRPLRLGAQGGGLEAARRRAGDDPRARLRVLLPHRRRRHRPDPRDGGALRGPRLGRRQPGQLPARGLRGRPDPAPPADGAVPLAAARGAARHRRRRGVGAAARGLRADPRPLRRRALRLRLDDGHLPGPPRGPRRRRRARDAAGGDRHHRQGVPAHPRPRRPGRAARAARAAGQRARRHPARPDVPARRAARRAAPPRRRAPVRRAALRRHAARPHPGRGQLRRLPDEPVRQGRRRGPRPAQARRARHPDAVLDGPRGRRDPAAPTGSTSTSTTSRRCRSTTRRPTS